VFSASHHVLDNLIILQVTVLEARNRVGGRVWDENIGGICVGHGAQLINGSYNNPFALLCLQVGVCFAIFVYVRYFNKITIT